MKSAHDSSRPPAAEPDTTAAPTANDPARRPGWSEIAVAAVGYGVLVFLGAQAVSRIPDDQQVAVGLANYALSALAGLGAFAAAVAFKIRRPALFGLRRTSGRWMLAGAGLGVVAFIISIVVSYLFSTLSGNTENVQSSYQAAARGGTIALMATLLLGSVATPIGEELAFRGVLTNALGRYGAWVAVLGSAVVFALAHGINPVLPVAFVEGIIAALLFRRTRSIWPGVFVHLVNNTLATMLPLVLASLS